MNKLAVACMHASAHRPVPACLEEMPGRARSMKGVMGSPMLASKSPCAKSSSSKPSSHFCKGQLTAVTGVAHPTIREPSHLRLLIIAYAHIGNGNGMGSTVAAVSVFAGDRLCGPARMLTDTSLTASFVILSLHSGHGPAVLHRACKPRHSGDL